MHGFVSSTSKRGHRQRRTRRYDRNGERLAVVRALTAAALHLGLPTPKPTLAEAVAMTGSSIGYLEAAKIVLKAEDPTLLDRVRRGLIPLISAAAQVKRRAELIAALRQASAEDRVAALKHVAGAEEILNIAVAAEAAE